MTRRTGRPQAASQHSLEREQLLLRAVDDVEVSPVCLTPCTLPCWRSPLLTSAWPHAQVR